MFAFFPGASLKIARNLIRVTGLKESLAVFQDNNFSNIGESEVLKILLAVDSCNLLQTMKEEFISKEISEEDLQDTVEDYVVENLKSQKVIACQDGAERMEQCQEILEIASKFQDYWNREDTKDPGPRFYCVKELLRRLNCEDNTPIHDSFFEFVYEQHNRFNRYFRTLLEPFREEANPEPPPLSSAIQSPFLESAVLPAQPPADLDLKKENPAKETLALSPPLPSGSVPGLSAEPAARPEEDLSPQAPKAPAYRKLDLQDPLSGFPIHRPWPGKIKTDPAAGPIPMEEKKPEPLEEVKPQEPAPGSKTQASEVPPPLPQAPPVEQVKENLLEEKLSQDPEKKAYPAIELDEAPKSYRKLDLQDPLSGFPIHRPWPGKVKAVEASEEFHKGDKNMMLSPQEASPKKLEPPAAAGEAESPAAELPDLLPVEPSGAEPGIIENPEDVQARPDPISRFSGLEPLPDGESDLERAVETPADLTDSASAPSPPPAPEEAEETEVESSKAAEPVAREDESEAGDIPLWEDFKKIDPLPLSQDQIEKPALDLDEKPRGEVGAPEEKISIPPAGLLDLENNLSAPPKVFSEENLPMSLRPTPKMLEDLFNQVNPIDPGESGKN